MLSAVVCWIASTWVRPMKPSPQPTSAQAALIQGTGASKRAQARREVKPVTMSMAPARATVRKPRGTMRRAATLDESAQKSIVGVTTAPAAAAVPPRAPCTKSGTKVSTPKIVVPRRTPQK